MSRKGEEARNQTDTQYYKDCCDKQVYIWPVSDAARHLFETCNLHLMEHTANVVGPTRCTPVRMSVVMV